MDLTRYARRYEIVRGSDSGNDTEFLELNDVTDGEPQTVLFGERSASGDLRFLSLVNLAPAAERALLLPLALVEEFVALMKQELGSSST